jgi:hypothetical protein
VAVLRLSDDLLQPITGSIAYLSPQRPGPDAGTWAIELPLLPFSAINPVDPDTFHVGTAGPVLIRTAIRLDFISLPGTELADIAGRRFDFPVNPDDGYIDGSLYLGGAHNPVDVTRIEFGPADDDHVEAVLYAAFDFTQERVDIENRTAVLHANVRYERLD